MSADAAAEAGPCVFVQLGGGLHLCLRELGGLFMSSALLGAERPHGQAAFLGTLSVLTGVSLSAQEVLENLKDRWYQADNPPSDLLLTEEEFLSFLHPEHSRGMLKFMVKEIVRDLGEARPGWWGLLSTSS